MSVLSLLVAIPQNVELLLQVIWLHCIYFPLIADVFVSLLQVCDCHLLDTCNLPLSPSVLLDLCCVCIVLQCTLKLTLIYADRHVLYHIFNVSGTLKDEHLSGLSSPSDASQ